MAEPEAAFCGGIDVGGTKIEAQLFGPDLTPLARRRLPTPNRDFRAFVQALAVQAEWLMAQTADRGAPIGVALPGIVDPATGASTAANLPIGGRDVAEALREACGRRFAFLNDCSAFALSEARGGAAEGAETALGLILGTGVAAGFCRRGPEGLGEAPGRLNRMAVEIGHVGIAARVLDRHGLPLARCGCGRMGCYETYVSGPGLARLAEMRLGEKVAPEDLGAHPKGETALRIWADLAAEALDSLRLTLDPEAVVLGGGLSRLPGVAERLAEALETRRLGDLRPPAIRVARFGDASGARGAALHAQNQRAKDSP